MTLIRANNIDSKRNIRNTVEVIPNGTARGNIFLRSNGVIQGGANINAYVLDKKGNLWGWGQGGNNAVGDNTATNRSSPVSVLGNYKFTQFAAGEASVFGLDYKGYLWSFGYNADGRLGNSTVTGRGTFALVSGNRRFSILMAQGCNRTSYAIDEFGYAYSWGDFTYGQGGDSSTIAKSIPTSVYGGKQFISISGTYNGAVALDHNGYAWTWGKNTSGELGTNESTTLSRSFPVSVVGGIRFMQISGNTEGINALDIQGYAWGWGYNQDGRIGDGTLTNRSSPSSVVGGKVFVKLATCGAHCLALDQLGFCWSWGQNGYGQLGDSSITGRNSPVSVFGNRQFIDIACNWQASYALDGRGGVWAWGYNDYGALGTNLASTASTSSPVMVVRLFQ